MSLKAFVVGFLLTGAIYLPFTPDHYGVLGVAAILGMIVSRGIFHEWPFEREKASHHGAPSMEKLREMDRVFMLEIAPYLRAADDPEGRKVACAWVNYLIKKRHDNYSSLPPMSIAQREGRA